jgi:hypothetical protein
MRSRRTFRRAASGLVLAAAATVVIPAAATAAPPAAPFDLAAAITQLSTGGDVASLAAARAINTARPGAAQDIATPDLLSQLGVQPFLYPTVAPFCTDGGGLGLTPAVAGAIPGPWPKLNLPIPLPIDTNVVKPGQTLFAFVPSGVTDGPNKSGMQVAWFNISSFQGGFAQLGTIGDVINNAVPPEVPFRNLIVDAINRYLGAQLPQGGVRAVPVDTGSGTVLAAIFGTVQNGAKSCFFLPTVGISAVK